MITLKEQFSIVFKFQINEVIGIEIDWPLKRKVERNEKILLIRIALIKHEIRNKIQLIIHRCKSNRPWTKRSRVHILL